VASDTEYGPATGLLGANDQGVPIEQIQDVLGHSSPTVTKTIYVESTRKIQRDAIDRLGFLFDE
jgi:integrase